ncbi:hypothetical protein HZY83_06750 [Gemella sp. GH3]|uniref:hypothetical protein n=1 Tax=unclassified Gemella TaxID=2624949 RepID=UPI0015CF9445|nr:MULTISPECIES: hypothetical protein [unclassified Gemella]MBF0714371.1 hypothetical protein [Gemella sp. GH3.1]NYS51323.1 hypothetical protein [Gemella sp. GH3]
MIKKHSKLFLIFIITTLLMVFCNLKSENTANAATFSPMLLDSNGEKVTDNLTFNITDSMDNSVITATSTNDGYIDFYKVKENHIYNVSMINNNKYIVEPISFIIKDGTPYITNTNKLFLSLKVLKNENKLETTKFSNLYLSVLSNGAEIKDDLEFIFTDGVTNIKSKNIDGQIFAKLKENTSYTLKLVNNNKYSMEEFSFTIKPDASGLSWPYIDSNQKLLLNVDLKEKISLENNEDNSNKSIINTLKIINQNGDNVNDELTFIFYNKSKNQLLGEFKTANGKLPKIKLTTDDIYEITLKENERYSMKKKNIYAFMDGLPVDVDDEYERLTEELVVENCGCEIENFKKVTINQMKIIDTNGNSVKDNLTFIFFNISKQRPLGEFISVGGMLPNIELIADDIYEVYVKENHKYGMKRKNIFAFMNHYPIDENDEYQRWFDTFEVIKKDENYVEPKEEKVPVEITTSFNNKIIKEKITFELISEDETIVVDSNDGVVKANLHPNVDYMVGLVNNDKYDIETFPLVVKNKIVGKFPYDHRTCDLVNTFNLVEKGTIIENNPRHTIEDENKTSRVTGMNFLDLKLVVEKINPENIDTLKDKDVDLYDIRFINVYRNEVVKIPTGNYTVTIPKIRGKEIKAIYYVGDNGKLEEHEIINGTNNSVVTFKTNHFSMYAIEYKQPNTNYSNNGENKPNNSENNKDSNLNNNQINNSTTSSDYKENNLNNDFNNNPIVKIDNNALNKKIEKEYNIINKTDDNKKLTNTGSTVSSNGYLFAILSIICIIIVKRKIKK